MINRTALTLEEVATRAPSVFAPNAVPGVSDRYQFVDTAAVLQRLMTTGYVPTSASQSASRTVEGKLYTKHVVRVTHERYLGNGPRQVGDVVLEVVITNSHNRSSAWHLQCGLYRLVCANGMVTNAGSFASVRVLHNDNRIHDLIAEGLEQIETATSAMVLPQVERMQKLRLTTGQTRDFALAATVLQSGKPNAAEVDNLLRARREEDARDSMWCVLNRIQENVIRGGYTTIDSLGRIRVAPGIRSATRDLDFNVRLWSLASAVTEELTA
jgi:hypothetical protein